MTYIIKQRLSDPPMEDLYGNVLLCVERVHLNKTKFSRSEYDEYHVFVPKAEVTQWGEWYNACLTRWPTTFNDKFTSLLATGKTLEQIKEALPL